MLVSVLEEGQVCLEARTLARSAVDDQVASQQPGPFAHAGKPGGGWP
jgi:hypothetical protein